MTYVRVVKRNQLDGEGYVTYDRKNLIRGDLRRLEQDSLDLQQTGLYAAFAGITMEQAVMVMRAFFLGIDDADFAEFYTDPELWEKLREVGFTEDESLHIEEEE